MSAENKHWYTCDICGFVSTPQSQSGTPDGWARAGLEFWNIPRHIQEYKFDICPTCIIPDKNSNPVSVGTFEKIYKAIVGKLKGEE